MSKWLQTKLGKVCKFTAGSAFKPEYQGQAYGEHPFIKVSDMNLSGNEIFINRANNFISETQRKELAAKLHPEGATVFAKIGVALTTNRRRLLTRPTIIDNNMMSATPDTNKITPRYLYFLLNTLDFNTIASGSALPYINISDLQNLDIRLPSVHEQRACEELLGSVDDKLDLNQRMNETLEAMARALFKSWFVDFDPVRAKAEGRNPEGIDAATAALFPATFNDDGLPEGWDKVPFSGLIEIIGGGTPKTTVDEYWNGTIPWFSVVDAPADTDIYVIDTEKKVTQAGVNNSSTKVLPVGTTIISARGTVGRVALVGVPMAMNQSCYGIRGSNGLPDYFTYFCVRQLVTELQARTHGSVFDTITRNTFDTVSFIKPDKSIAAAFDKSVSSIMQQVLNNLHESRTLAELRDTLLPKLISGELRIDEAEDRMREAV